jgi:predicted HTH transcriptional regulator
MNQKILKLIEQGEGISLDFKQVIQSPYKIAKSMVSFANTHGGILLIGVKDNGNISGINPEEEFHMLELAANFFSKPEVKFTVEPHVLNGKQILLVDIPKGENQPYYAKGEDEKWWVYVRVNDNCILASKTTVDFMHAQKKGGKVTLGKIEQGILNYLKEHPKVTQAEICQMFNLGNRRAARILVSLMKVQAIRSHTLEKYEFYTLY